MGMENINRQAAQVLRDYAEELDNSNGLAVTMETLTDLTKDIEALRIEGIVNARRWHCHWDRIGSWLGISKQGARQRYGRHVASAEAERAARARREAQDRLNTILDKSQAVADRIAGKAAQ